MNTIASLDFCVKGSLAQSSISWSAFGAGALAVLLAFGTLASIEQDVTALTASRDSLDKSLTHRRKSASVTKKDAGTELQLRMTTALLDFPWNQVFAGIETLNGEQVNLTKFDATAKDRRVTLTVSANDYSTANSAVDRLKNAEGVAAWHIGSISRTPVGLRAQVVGTVE